MWSPSRPTNGPSQTTTPEPTKSSQSQSGAAAATNRPHNDGSTYIGKSLIIKGEISGSEPLHIEGRVEGPIAAPNCHISIGRDAVLLSNVHAGEVIVRGTMHGNLTAIDRVEVHSGGSLTGDVSAACVTIELGAHFKGKVDMRRPDPRAHIELDKSDKKPAQVQERSLALTT
ncbi:MAG: polymer-forming cytoskeletal protein [Terriglobales bacterium]|jgi:cytoskeletal protein CcmA (bactofilin family)